MEIEEKQPPHPPSNTLPCHWNFSYHYVLFAGSCPENQECIDIANCEYATTMNTLANLTTNEDIKNHYNEFIKETMCGGPSLNTVCCDITQGIS